MDMMLVLGILALIYFISVLMLCIYRFKINVKLWNTVFIVLDFLAYSCWNYAAYQLGWIDGGWMTLGNISPLMFTMILLIPFMKESVREYVYSAVAFLSVGMFMAMLISPEHSYIFNFNREASFLYASEAVAHMVCSFFGVYLVLTGQVKADFKHWVKSAVFLYSVITFGVILNFVFHKNHFGMDPYGGASIYMLDIFTDFPSTLIAYYFGVALVITVGMQVMHLLEKATSRSYHNEEGCASDGDTAQGIDTQSLDGETVQTYDDMSLEPVSFDGEEVLECVGVSLEAKCFDTGSSEE